MEDFHDVRFPVSVAFGATGGPERRTEIVALGSGHERRNQRWRRSRRRFDAGTGMRGIADLRAVVAFFEARRGALHAFRYRDPLDHEGAMQATGDGTRTLLEMAKLYGAFERRITHPVEGTVSVAVDGAAALPQVDHLAGTVTFADPPAPGAQIEIAFEFDVPVRFDTDRLDVSLAAFEAGEVPTIPLVEVLT